MHVHVSYRGQVVYWVCACFVLKFALLGEEKGANADIKTKHTAFDTKITSTLYIRAAHIVGPKPCETGYALQPLMHEQKGQAIN